MKCPKCGAWNAAYLPKCTQCGAPLPNVPDQEIRLYFNSSHACIRV